MTTMGSNFTIGNAIPCTAGEDLLQGDLVYVDAGTDTVKKATSSNKPIGTAWRDCKSGEVVDVVTEGSAAIRIKATTTPVAIGDTLVATTTAGVLKVDNAATGATVGTARVAYAKATGSTGQIVLRALLNIQNV